MKLRINNIKCRFFLDRPDQIRKTLKNIEGIVGIEKTGNIATIRCGDCVYIVFSSGHVNLSGVKSLAKIKECVDLFLLMFSLYHMRSEVVVTVDNISASTKLKHPIEWNVEAIKKKLGPKVLVSFNQSCFPGISVKTRRGTLILFRSGSISVVGVKNQRGLRRMKKLIRVVRELS